MKGIQGLCFCSEFSLTLVAEIQGATGVVGRENQGPSFWLGWARAAWSFQKSEVSRRWEQEKERRREMHILSQVCRGRDWRATGTQTLNVPRLALW